MFKNILIYILLFICLIFANENKKKIIIDGKAFAFVKPQNQIKLSSKYIYLVAEALNRENHFSKKIDVKTIENLIKKKFTLCWRWFYRMQIPLVIGYHKFMQDLSTFHVWGTICMNQSLNVTKNLKNTETKKLPLDHGAASKILIDNVGSTSGISAMSISDMTLIPRATVIRKCKHLIKNDLIKIFGEPSTISTFDIDVWIYIERKKTGTNLMSLGQKKILVNNVLSLELNDQGLLVKKDLKNIDDMKELEFNPNDTSIGFRKRTFVYDFVTTLIQKINDPLGTRKKRVSD